MRSKTMNATGPDQLTSVEFFGDPKAWKTLCKACCHDEGWMKSTKAMEIPGFGCLVQVTTHQVIMGGNDHAVAEALTLVPQVKIVNDYDEAGLAVIGRRLVGWNTEEQVVPEPEMATPEDETLEIAATSDIGLDTTDETTTGPTPETPPIGEPSKTLVDGPINMDIDDQPSLGESEAENIDGMGPLQQGTQETLG